MKQLFAVADKCLACRSCEIACAVQHSSSKELVSSLYEKTGPMQRVYVESLPDAKSMPLQCRHCEEPYCVDACISGAISKDLKGGLICIDEVSCVGCWMCVMVCPFGVVRPSRDKKVSVRCDLCQGEEVPACVRACPTKAIFYADVKDFKKDKKKKRK